MKIAFIWWTMGPYHFARMNAIARQEDIDLTVYEIAPYDDHFWDISEKGTSLFNHIVVTDRNLNNITKIVGALKLFLINNLLDFDVVIDGLGYSNVMSFLLKPNQQKFVLWSESTLIDNRRSVIKDWVISRLIKNYSAAIVAGKRHRKMLTTFRFPNDSIFEVGNVIDNDFFSPKTPENSDVLRILFVGRLLTIKNVSFLINSFSKVQKDFGNQVKLELKIVGSGEEEMNLKEEAKDIPNITFLGNLQPSQLREEYRKASFFVLPSISEPWGLVVNEAMASGLPILISENCGCIPELIVDGENGYTFNPSNSKDLCSKIIKLCEMDNTDRLKMGERSLEIIQDFSPDKYARNVTNALKAIV